MRAATAALGLTALLVLAACDQTSGDGKSPTPAATTAGGSGTAAAAPLLDDCAALAAMVPKDVSTGMGVDNVFGSPFPSTEKEYSAYCNLIGPSTADSRLRVGMQLRLIRPRVDPYESKPLPEWLRSKPRELTSVGECGTPAAWSAVPGGYRCFKDDTTGATRLQIVAGADKGTVVQVQVTMVQTDKQNLVPLDTVRGASDKAAEATIKAVFNGI